MRISQMTQRFSLWGGITVIIFVLMLSCAQPQEEEKFIGIQLWSVRHDMNEDPVATLQKLGEMGYKFIEAAGYADGKFYGMQPGDFRDLVEASGMRFLSSHVGHHLPDQNGWEDAMEWWDEAIDAHVAAGVKYMVQPSMSQAGYESLEGLKQYCNYFNAIGEKCNAHGIRFGYHNHADEFEVLEGEIIYDFMLQNTSPEKVMFQLDLYWIDKGGKDPVTYFQNYPGRFETWHVKDEQEVGASGKIDFERIFDNAENSGMEYLIVEVESYNYEPLESVRHSLNYLLDADFVRTP